MQDHKSQCRAATSLPERYASASKSSGPHPREIGPGHGRYDDRSPSQIIARSCAVVSIQRAVLSIGNLRAVSLTGLAPASAAVTWCPPTSALWHLLEGTTRVSMTAPPGRCVDIERDAQFLGRLARVQPEISDFFSRPR
jgi:hypothetical protein